MSPIETLSVYEWTTEGRVQSGLPDLLTIDEVADYLSVTKNTVYGWRKERTGPPAIKIGKHLRFPKGALLEWVYSPNA